MTGLAINRLGSGLTVFRLRTAFADAAQTPTIPLFDTFAIPGFAGLPWIGPILFQQNS